MKTKYTMVLPEDKWLLVGLVYPTEQH